MSRIYVEQYTAVIYEKSILIRAESPKTWEVLDDHGFRSLSLDHDVPNRCFVMTFEGDRFRFESVKAALEELGWRVDA